MEPLIYACHSARISSYLSAISLVFRTQGGAVDARRVLSVAWLSLPVGMVVATAVVYSVLYMSDAGAHSAYRNAVLLHGEL